MSDSREKKPRKAKTKMGEEHYRCIWYDDNSKHRVAKTASISQRHFGSDVLKRTFRACLIVISGDIECATRFNSSGY